MENFGITSDASVYFLTYSVVEWLPIFVSETACKIVTDSLCYCHANKHLRINAFVIMPTHVHLIAFDAAHDSKRLEKALADFRKFTGRQLSDYCTGGHVPKCFADVLREQSTTDRTRRFRQPSRRAEAIETEPFWQQKHDYLHDNPRRKGLVRLAEHWRYSSAIWYVSDGIEAVDVPITAIGW